MNYTKNNTPSARKQLRCVWKVGSNEFESFHKSSSLVTTWLDFGIMYEWTTYCISNDTKNREHIDTKTQTIHFELIFINTAFCSTNWYEPEGVISVSPPLIGAHRVKYNLGVEPAGKINGKQARHHNKSWFHWHRLPQWHFRPYLQLRHSKATIARDDRIDWAFRRG